MDMSYEILSTGTWHSTVGERTHETVADDHGRRGVRNTRLTIRRGPVGVQTVSTVDHRDRPTLLCWQRQTVDVTVVHHQTRVRSNAYATPGKRARNPRPGVVIGIVVLGSSFRRRLAVCVTVWLHAGRYNDRRLDQARSVNNTVVVSQLRRIEAGCHAAINLASPPCTTGPLSLLIYRFLRCVERQNVEARRVCSRRCVNLAHFILYRTW